MAPGCLEGKKTILSGLGREGKRPSSFSRKRSWGPAELLRVRNSRQPGEKEEHRLRSQVWGGQCELQEECNGIHLLHSFAPVPQLFGTMTQVFSLVALLGWGPRPSQKPTFCGIESHPAPLRGKSSLLGQVAGVPMGDASSLPRDNAAHPARST